MNLVSPSGINRKTFDECEGSSEFRHALRSIRAAGGTPLWAGELQNVRQLLRGRGHVLFRPRRLPEPQELESVASIFRNMRRLHEPKTFDAFDRETSLALDGLRVARESCADSRGLS